MRDEMLAAGGLPMRVPIFVVGCPRSGTTLLQSILGNHPEIRAFPESNALFQVAADIKLRSFGPETQHRHVLKQRLLGALNRWGLAAGRERRFRRELQAFLHGLGADDLAARLPARIPTMAGAFACFDAALTELVGDQRWLEKSPKNLFILDHIDRHLPHARIVHVLRNGPDNIASLRDAGMRHRDFRGDIGGSDGVRNALAQWNQALRTAAVWWGHERHMHIRHEDLCADPECVVRDICGFLELDFDVSMLHYAPDAVSWSHEDWKRQRGTRIQAQPSRFATALSVEERQMVEREALDVERHFPRRFEAVSRDRAATMKGSQRGAAPSS